MRVVQNLGDENDEIEDLVYIDLAATRENGLSQNIMNRTLPSSILCSGR